MDVQRTTRKGSISVYYLCFVCSLAATLSQGCGRKSGNSGSVVKMSNQQQQQQSDNSIKESFVCGRPSIEFVTREQWGARPPKSRSFIDTRVNMTFIHHTAMAECMDKDACIGMMQIVQNFHMDDRGWDDIGYSFLVGEDGRVYEGRGWNVVGAHTQHYNSVAYGFCVMGNFMNKLPNQKALTAIQAIIDCGVEKGYIQTDYEMFGHRDGRCTDCPGDELYKLIQTWSHYSHRNITKYC